MSRAKPWCFTDYGRCVAEENYGLVISGLKVAKPNYDEEDLTIAEDIYLRCIAFYDPARGSLSTFVYSSLKKVRSERARKHKREQRYQPETDADVAVPPEQFEPHEDLLRVMSKDPETFALCRTLGQGLPASGPLARHVTGGVGRTSVHNRLKKLRRRLLKLQE